MYIDRNLVLMRIFFSLKIRCEPVLSCLSPLIWFLCGTKDYHKCIFKSHFIWTVNIHHSFNTVLAAFQIWVTDAWPHIKQSSLITHLDAHTTDTHQYQFGPDRLSSGLVIAADFRVLKPNQYLLIDLPITANQYETSTEQVYYRHVVQPPIHMWWKCCSTYLCQPPYW